MPKTKISEFSATPGNNTDIDGINIAEGCAPSGINDAIRELMAQLKDFQAGTAGDSFNGPVGTTTAAAGAFTTLSASSTVSGAGFSTYLASPPAIGGTAAAAGSFTTLTTSSTVTHNGGTANGVAYLNGSKVLTTGSALTFDGTRLFVGTTAVTTSSSQSGEIYSTGATGFLFTNTTAGNYPISVKNEGASGTRNLINFFEGAAGGTSRANISFDGSNNLAITPSNALIFGASSSEQMRLTSTGLGIGTSSPGVKLDVSGADGVRARVVATAAGTSGLILSSSGTTAYSIKAGNGDSSLRIDQDGTDRITLASGGNLGIGTSSPSVKLDVVGAINATSNITSGGVLQALTTVQSSSGADLSLNANGANRDIIYKVNATELMRLVGSSGNLGIGTSSPSAKLHVSTSSAGSYGAIIYNTSATGEGLTIRGGSTSSHNALVVQDYNGANSLLAVQGGGNVGIGTSSPAYKLNISGNGYLLGLNGGGTNRVVQTFGNTGGGLDLGIEGSAGGTVFTGGSAYAGVIGTSNSTVLQLGTNGTIRATLDTSGNLGLGVTPSAWRTDVSFKALQMPGGSFTAYMAGGVDQTPGIAANGYVDAGGTWRYINSRAASWYIQNGGMHIWYNAPSGTAGNAITFTQAMTLDASGNLLVGTTSGSYKLTVEAAASLANFYSTTHAAELSIKGTATNVLTFAGGTGDSLAFETGSTERARITSGGDFLVGTTSGAFTGKVVALQATSASNVITAWNSATTGDNSLIGFFTDGGTGRGSITYNRAGGLVAYNTTSDYRAKDIIGPTQNTGSTIDALKIYEGVMKGATQSRPMMIAHEAQAVVPFCVSGEKDEVNEDGTPKYQQMDHASLVPLLIAEIQSLRQRVAALEAK